MLSIWRLWRQFASTFKEWHYFVGGASLGFVLGWLSASEYLYRRFMRGDE